MKKYVTIVYLFLISIIFSQNSPKIALVLSGGSAKGIAQIPTLEIIDSLNIPIDMIIGTSMGSLTGVAYAMGHSADEMKKMAFDTDWDIIFSNNKKRENLFFLQKDDYDKYKATFELDGLSPIPPIAFINGHNSYINLTKTTGIYETITNFDDLFIPFRCVAFDLITGNEIIFSSGSLSKSLRASTSIPNIFSPVKDNQFLLVDGGVKNNFPTDIAKSLEFDFIIGVNVSSTKKVAENDISTFTEVIGRLISLNGYNKKLENLNYADILIKHDINNESGLNFSDNNMQEIYKSGKRAVYNKIDDFIALKSLFNSEESKPVTFNSIKDDFIMLEDIIINSTDNIKSSDLFNFNFPKVLDKNEFLSLMYNLRNSDKYIHINYKILKGEKGYVLNLNIKKSPIRLINKVIIKDNKKLSKSFIKEILNIKQGDKLDFNLIRENINNAYNLDYFKSIRYEIEYEQDETNLVFIIEESNFNKLKLSAAWHNYYKIFGQIKLDLIDVPLKKFRFTDEITLGNSLRENNINIYYINNFNFQSWVIPVIKIKNSKKKISIYNSENNLVPENLYNKNYSFNLITPFKKYGNINLGINKQKNKYQNRFDNELIKFYSLNINIDQIDNLLYPKKGYIYEISAEQGLEDFKYNLNSFRFDHFIRFNSKSRIKLYGDAIYSNLSKFQNSLFQKSITYFPYDRTLSFSEYNLMVTNLTSYGIEFNIDYKNSTTVRILYNYINNVDFKHNNQSITNLNSYGFGLRVKSILGPLNFMWTSTNDPIYNVKSNNYFFSFGFNY